MDSSDIGLFDCLTSDLTQDFLEINEIPAIIGLFDCLTSNLAQDFLEINEIPAIIGLFDSLTSNLAQNFFNQIIIETMLLKRKKSHEK